jgi:hypothetical protein
MHNGIFSGVALCAPTSSHFIGLMSPAQFLLPQCQAFRHNVNVAFVAFRVSEMLPTKPLAFNDVADVANFRVIIKT